MAEIEKMIERKAKQMTYLLNAKMPPGLQGERRRQRIEVLRQDLLELLAIRRRLRQLQRPHGPVGQPRMPTG